MNPIFLSILAGMTIHLTFFAMDSLPGETQDTFNADDITCDLLVERMDKMGITPLTAFDKNDYVFNEKKDVFDEEDALKNMSTIEKLLTHPNSDNDNFIKLVMKNLEQYVSRSSDSIIKVHYDYLVKRYNEYSKSPKSENPKSDFKDTKVRRKLFSTKEN